MNSRTKYYVRINTKWVITQLHTAARLAGNKNFMTHYWQLQIGSGMFVYDSIY